LPALSVKILGREGTAARMVIRIVCDVSGWFGGGDKYGYEGKEETVVFFGWIIISWRYR
jgi:hypothetical protein